MATSPSSSVVSTTEDSGGSPTISFIHPDILQTHFLPRLDGFSLTSLSCASSYLHSISTVESLWRDVSISQWPSINHPRVQRIITSFRNGHRSFFSDCFPLLSLPVDPTCHHPNRPSDTPEIISAVDIYYQSTLIFSKVHETDASTEWFEYPSFRVDLIDPKENLRTPIEMKSLKDLEENLTLSWIVIDPTRKRAANFSSFRRVSVERHWLTRDIRVKYATILAGNGFGSLEPEFVECKVVVTCGRKEEGMLHLKEVCMQVEDMRGNPLNGKDSLGFLVHAMEYGKRERGDEERKRYNKQYLEFKSERRQRKLVKRRIHALKVGCVAVGISIAVALCWLFLVINNL
ncbi:hypothetical protein Ancab_007520 [Ancistrocladus abbreviatus]